MNMFINFQSPLMFISAVFVLFFNFLVYFKNRKSRVNLSFAIFGISIFVWLFSFAVAYRIDNLILKLFWFKLGYVGIIFIAINFYTFIFYLTNRKRDRFIVISNYFLGLFFLIVNFSKFPLIIGHYEYPWGHYPKAFIPMHIVFLTFFILLFSLSNTMMAITLIKKRKRFSQVQYMRIKYAFAGSIVGSLGGLDFIGNYGINFPPIGFIFMFLYPMIFAYAILKYRFMDVTIAITRTGIFITVYSLILGIPFVVAYCLRSFLVGLFGDNWWIGPLVLSTFLATTGPFIYLYIQRRAEDRLLREQRRYQQTLRRASVGMTRIRDLKKLLNLIVHIVTRTVRLKHSSIYLIDANGDKFTLHAFRDKRKSRPLSIVENKSSLIQSLNKDKESIVYEEIKQRAQDFNDPRLFSIQKQMESLNAAVVVPSLVEENLIGFIVLGEKISGQLYSQDDLSVFSVLANQAALAIENAQFYEDIKETQTQLFQAEKMATIGTMADGLSHQINNRFHALGMIATDTLDALKSINEKSQPEEIKQVFSQLRHALERVKENVKQGGEVVHGLLKYSRTGEAGFEAVDLDVLIDASLEMAQYKIKLNQIDLIRDYPKDKFKMEGNFVQLQEVVFNLIDNAYDAIIQRKNELKEPNYRGNVTIQATTTDSKVEIRFIDNGIGVKDADKSRLFTPFFTTKTSSRKGTGLGLYVIQKIVVNNHKGKISYKSEYGTGTMFIIELPVTRK